MLIVSFELLAAWVTLAAVTGLAFGALISSAEKARREESLEYIFARIAMLPAYSRGINSR
jgi:hypothetical protein